MTHGKNFKRRVRERMAKTGERYAVARQHIEAQRASEDEVAELSHAHDVMKAGFELPQDEVARLERHLEARPNDVDARTKLMGYYFLHGEDADAASKRARHISWIVQHRPEASIAGLPPALLDPGEDDESHDLVRTKWLEVLERRKDDPAVLRNAATFLRHSDPETAIALLRAAKMLKPRDPGLALALGVQLTLGGAHENALTAFEDALQLSSDDADEELTPELQRFYHLGQAARSALAAGERVKAHSYAEELLALAPRHPDDWNFGNAIHDGHQVLGALALDDGELVKARGHLLASARTKGSPQLDSFGPSLRLARALLERGERETVLEYLRLCRGFWDESEQLDEWTGAIERGEVPEGFGAGSMDRD